MIKRSYRQALWRSAADDYYAIPRTLGGATFSFSFQNSSRGQSQGSASDSDDRGE